MLSAGGIFYSKVPMSNPTPPLDDAQIVSSAAELCWVHILRQLAAMQILNTRDKVHSVGRGKQ